MSTETAPVPLSVARPAVRSGVAAGVMFILVSAAAFSLQGIFARLAYQHGANAATTGGGRFAVAGAFLWLYVAYRARRGNFPLRLPGRTLAALLVLGAAGYFLGSFSYLRGVQ